MIEDVQLYTKLHGAKSDSTKLFSANGFRHSLLYLTETFAFDYRLSISFKNRNKYSSEKISTTEILYSIAKSISHRIQFQFNHRYNEINLNDPEISEWIGMLTVIPGISREIAQAIVSHYPSFSSLMEKYISDQDEILKLDLLSDIVVDCTNISHYSEEMIGLKTSSTIYHYFIAK